ncbi:MAG: orotidine-5'-phosphate decarboxylase [Flavobacteriales bacterium]|nr:orotidine-5'-phosphate decarboxylase [Flavobacteriales bacterium]
MTRNELVEAIRSKKTFLCVGLDPDPQKIPESIRKLDNPLFEFNKRIIDATKDYCVAYKPNTAFYESQGAKGWEALKKTRSYIGDSHFTIADAKRGDIGNTSSMYAKAFFEDLNYDSVTVAPYMGSDSVQPFLAHDNRWVILLALTSNRGADDFQFFSAKDGERLFEKVLKTSQKWGSNENMMYVVGATRPEKLKEIRALAPNYFLLVPGVGAQGGDLKAVCEYGMNHDVGLLINSSRGIIHASSEDDFDMAAREAAKRIAQQMNEILS